LTSPTANRPSLIPAGFNPATLFKPLVSPETQRTVVAVWGDKDTGKTHFALTFPAPIRLLDLDMGAEDLAGKFANKTIIHAPISVEDPSNPASVAQALTLFHHAWTWALTESAKDGGTVVVDTAGQLWQWVQTVKLAEVKNKKYRAEVAKKGGDESKVDYENIKLHQFEYAEANNFMASLLRRALAHEGANVVFIHHSQPKYDSSGNNTGRIEPRWFREMPNIVPTVIQMFRNPQDGTYTGKIDKLRADGTRVGLMIPNLDYLILDTLVHPSK
jgi:hypothetical protein